MTFAGMEAAPQSQTPTEGNASAFPPLSSRVSLQANTTRPSLPARTLAAPWKWSKQ